MDIQSIKQLMKDGDFPQARELLEKHLAKTSGDEVAQMLYGTCCQIMGDTETFGSIYQRLAPEMERCVKRGEQSERATMWVKYAAMFAMLLMCGTQIWGKNDYYVTIDDDDDQPIAMSTNGENGEFGRVLKMSPRDRMLYFLKRPEVSRELHKGNARAIFIPMRENGIGWFSRKADNLLLIRVDSPLKTASEVVKALKEAKDGETEKGEVFVRFSPFKQIGDTRSVERLASGCEKRVKWQEESVLKQEERVREQEGRVRAQEEAMQSFKDASEERIRANKLLEDEDCIRKLEEQMRTLKDRIRKRNELESQIRRLDELENELRSVEKCKEAIQSVMDLDKQEQSLEERRKEMLTPEEADKLEKEIQALNERMREIRRNNSIGRRRKPWSRELLELVMQLTQPIQHLVRLRR